MNQFDWDGLLQDCVEFTQQLIRTPSMSGEEGEIATLVLSQMQQLAFDEVWIDEMGNVGGRIHGADRTLGALVLNAHLDHVDPGDLSQWPYPPYSGQIADDRIFGRGACDIKGPLAAQIYAMAALLRSNERPKRDIVFSGVVREETGGDGALFWAKQLDYPVDLIILGEPSSNNLSQGHRGIYQVWVTFQGRSVHASAPTSGNNPIYPLAEFIRAISRTKSKLSIHPVLGPTTVSPTIVEVDTQSPNVTPAWARVLLDYRTASESPDSLGTHIAKAAGDSDWYIENVLSEELDAQSSDEAIFGYYTPEGRLTQIVQDTVARGMGRKPALTKYQFATDGRHFARYKIPVLGFSPGEEALAHTVQESISIAMMAESLRGQFELIRSF